MVGEILTVAGNPDVNGNGILNLSFAKQAQPLNTQQIQINISVTPVDDQVGINILEFTKIGPVHILLDGYNKIDGVGVAFLQIQKRRRDDFDYRYNLQRGTS